VRHRDASLPSGRRQRRAPPGAEERQPERLVRPRR
jgi:hypothetical protein